MATTPDAAVRAATKAMTNGLTESTAKVSPTVAPITFLDTSEDCAICLCPLTPDAATLTLSCGHRWHLECLKDQLRHAQPDRSRRLLFAGCRCAKCGAYCDHPELEHLTRKTDALRAKVDELISEQLSADAAAEWAAAAGDDGRRRRLIEEGRRSYAFYLCGSCEEPYFGGTVDCADQAEGELPAGEGDRLCPGCTPTSQLACSDPVRHRGSHVWKCRYCCSPASHVCYGTVHFCDGCHERNGRRVRERRSRSSGGTSDPPPLEAVQCPGASCPHPKPAGQDRHDNGPSCRCEQVYRCAWCESAPAGARHASHQEPGSRNFLANPSGQDGLRGWQHLTRPMQWAVEESEVPLDGDTTINFVSSFRWCVMAQQVSLPRFVSDPTAALIEVAARYKARTDCPSIFRMEAALVDAHRQEVARQATDVLDAPADYWETARLVFEPTESARDVVIILYGKDGRFWQGRFGSKVAGCSVRVLGTEEELDRLLTAEGRQGAGATANDGATIVRRPMRAQRAERGAQNNPRIRGIVQQEPLEWVQNHAFDIFLPVALVIFTWIMSQWDGN